jgi:hypothetical protein
MMFEFLGNTTHALEKATGWFMGAHKTFSIRT